MIKFYSKKVCVWGGVLQHPQHPPFPRPWIVFKMADLWDIPRDLFVFQVNLEKNPDFNHFQRLTIQGSQSWYSYRNCMWACLQKVKYLFGDGRAHVYICVYICIYICILYGINGIESTPEWICATVWVLLRPVCLVDSVVCDALQNE